MKERGKFLVSTEAAGTTEKTKAVISGVLFFIFALVIFSEGFADFIGNRGVSIFLGVAAIIYAGVVVYLTFARLKSYCAVYENGIIGTTAPTLQNKGECFEFRYDQISSVSNTTNKKAQTIIITANGRTYEVLALENCMKAVSEIRARIQ